MPGLSLHTVDLGGRVEITPKSAMALKTDVHLSVIYSTRPVSVDKVNLACHPPSWLWIALLDTLGSRSGWMSPNASWLSACTCDCTVFFFMCVWLMKRRKLLCVCMLKCVIAGPKRTLISALRQPLAQPSGFLKCPTVFSLTYNSQVNVSLPSYSSSLWIITDFILTCVFP